jgi:hypothetical protein
MDWELTERLKKLAIQALVSDDELMGVLILKGGNALDLIHKIAARASLDLDFSMRESFDDGKLTELETRVANLVEGTFRENGYYAYDIELNKKPSFIKGNNKDFWGGYEIVFKVINFDQYMKLGDDIDTVRRNSIVFGLDRSTKLKIQISSFEYCPDPTEMELDGYTIFVYSPLLIAIEKLRAICQQMIPYAKIVSTMTRTPRARDFFEVPPV